MSSSTSSSLSTPMEGISIRDKLLELHERRKAIENDVEVLTIELESTGAGVKGKLIDSEGFPRGDVDIYDVTHKRNKLATLNFDHKAIMKDIEALLPTFYAEQAANSNQSSSNDSNNNSSSSSNHSSSDKSNGKSTSILNTSVFINFIPIAIIDEVFPQSPAALAGIKEGDALIKFADITQQSFEPFKRIAELVGRSLNIPIELVINRKGEIISLSLTPKIWSGRGTLGCHLAPINH